MFSPNRLLNSRLFTTSVACSAAARKDAKFSRQMAKMIARDVGKKARNKTHWYLQPAQAQSSVLETKTNSSPGNATRAIPKAGASRRSRQVASVLYRYISHIISSGELHPTLADYSVDIAKVTVADNFMAVNISWQATGNMEEDGVIEQILNSHAGKLRTMLTSLHLLSQIPRIHFFKDLREVQWQEVEELLRVADFGDDYQPQESLTSLGEGMRMRKREMERENKHDVVINTENLNVVGNSANGTERSEQQDTKSVLSENVNFTPNAEEFDSKLNTDKSINNIEDENSTIIDENIVKGFDKLDAAAGFNFRSNIYGLNRDELLNKVTISMNKSKDRNFGRQEFNPETPDNLTYALKKMNQDRMKRSEKSLSNEMIEQQIEMVYDNMLNVNRKDSDFYRDNDDDDDDMK